MTTLYDWWIGRMGCCIGYKHGVWVYFISPALASTLLVTGLSSSTEGKILAKLNPPSILLF